MRKITTLQITTFFCLFGLALLIGVYLTKVIFGSLPLGDFRGVLIVFFGLVVCFLSTVLVYRCFLAFCPLPEGDKPVGSREEFVYHVYVLFYLIVFYPVIFPGFLPIPVVRRVYMLLGAKIGPNSYGSTSIVDPPLTEIGAECVLGQASIISGHHIVGNRLVHKKVVIGDRVTIGGGVLMGAGVRVGSGAVIGPGAVVTPLSTIGEGAVILPNSYVKLGSKIKAGETWGGIPAVCIKRQSPH